MADQVTYRGCRGALELYPLERLFGRPGGRPRPSFALSSCMATWEIDDAGRLWLVGLGPYHGPGDRLAEVFPDHPGRVPADRFTGDLDVVLLDYLDDLTVRMLGRRQLACYRGAVVLHEEISDRPMPTGPTSRLLRRDVLRREIVARPDGLFAAAEWPLLAADLDGDGPTRSVYADWLEERGDPRGALLRLAVRGRPDEGTSLPGQLALEATAEGWAWLRLLGLTDRRVPYT